MVVTLIAVMGFLAGGYHGSRKALGIGYFKRSDPTRPGPGKLEANLSGARPVRLLVAGVVGLLIILWLMLFKPV